MHFHRNAQHIWEASSGLLCIIMNYVSILLFTIRFIIMIMNYVSLFQWSLSDFQLNLHLHNGVFEKLIFSIWVFEKFQFLVDIFNCTVTVEYLWILLNCGIGFTFSNPAVTIISLSSQAKPIPIKLTKPYKIKHRFQFVKPNLHGND